MIVHVYRNAGDVKCRWCHFGIGVEWTKATQTSWNPCTVDSTIHESLCPWLIDEGNANRVAGNVVATHHTALESAISISYPHTIADRWKWPTNPMCKADTSRPAFPCSRIGSRWNLIKICWFNAQDYVEGNIKCMDTPWLIQLKLV